MIFLTFLLSFMRFLAILAVAIFFFVIGNKTGDQRKDDYSRYPIVEAKVVGQLNNRWIVKFVDFNGDVVLGIDNETILKRPRKGMPVVKNDSKELVYFWRYDLKEPRTMVNEKTIKYAVHFKNPDYAITRIKMRNRRSDVFNTIGVLTIFLAFFVYYISLSSWF